MFQFTHPGKGATPLAVYSAGWQGVSIHAPWEGCDFSKAFHKALSSSFNSRTLGRVRLTPMPTAKTPRCCFNSRTLGRVRQESVNPELASIEFQFTHPGKGATCRILPNGLSAIIGFNSRTLGRVRRGLPYWDCSRLHVSIHAPWEGCDKHKFAGWYIGEKFQFTHPGKGATGLPYWDCSRLHVSIHAPWEGCDQRRKLLGLYAPEFQFTHPGKGATRSRSPPTNSMLGFQFTHPGKGATPF